MKRAWKAIAIAAAIVAAVGAWQSPAEASCATSQFLQQCFAGGGVSPTGGMLGGDWWVQGIGKDFIGTGGVAGNANAGTDAGQLAGPDAVTAGWLTDFGGAACGDFCISWNMESFGSDCETSPGGLPLIAVISDNQDNYAVMSVADSGVTGTATWDFDLVTNGGSGPCGGVGNYVTLQHAVVAAGATSDGVTVNVNVMPLQLNAFDDVGGTRQLPLQRELASYHLGVRTPTAVDPDVGGMVNVPADSQLCWDMVDGLYTATLGCIAIGGATPSQGVVNGRASKGRGDVVVSWDVTAQLDVLGFNVIQKDPTRNVERKLNDDPIFSGQNDATGESYSVSFGRNDLRGSTRSAIFEIELVQQNGTTTRYPVVYE